MENGEHQPQRDMSHPHHLSPSSSTKAAGEKPSSFSGSMEYGQIRFPFFNQDGSTDVSMSDVSDRDSDPNEDQTEEHTALKCHDCGAILPESLVKESTPPALGRHGQAPAVALEFNPGATEGLSDSSSSPLAKETDAHVTGESKSSATRDSQAALNTSPPRKSTSQTTQILEEEEKSGESPVTHPSTNKGAPTTKDPSGTPKTSTADEQYCRQCGNFQPKSEFRNQQHPSLETKNFPSRGRLRGGPAGRWRQCITCRTWSNKRRDKTAQKKGEKGAKEKETKDKQRHPGEASGNDPPDSSSSSSSSPSKGNGDLGDSQPVAPGAAASTLASSLLSKVVAAKKARLARAEEATRGDETEDAARGAVYDVPLARSNTSVAASADKGGEASKASTATTTITPRIDVTTPLDLRGGWLPDSPPTKPLRQQQVPDTTTTATTTDVPAATTATLNTSSDSTTAAEVAMSLAESEPWNTPYDASMPISEEMFSMSRAYLLGLLTTSQLRRAHGESLFLSIQRHVIDFVGLVIPDIPPLMFAHRIIAKGLQAALVARVRQPPESLKPNHMLYLNNMENDFPALASLLHNTGVARRFVMGLQRHIDHLGRDDETEKNQLEKEKGIETSGAGDGENKGDNIMQSDNLDSEGDVDITEWVWV
ncbi:hypothetical protein PG996_010786 [Apiospora saccharicola]|uniref:Restriction of telomere capping protein 4 n=1 Tax=Apiospora saccharicola TaxID=335842 RepID=A0ABR1UPL3_9PEZI